MRGIPVTEVKMASEPKRAALYLRVSTDGQTVDNQRLALEAVCEQRGWQITQVYADNGISGAKGRNQRPDLDALLKDAARGRFDVVMAWALDRLGRSLLDLLDTLGELEAAGVARQSRHRCGPNRSSPRRVPRDALSVHPCRANREYPRRLISALRPTIIEPSAAPAEMICGTAWFARQELCTGEEPRALLGDHVLKNPTKQH